MAIGTEPISPRIAELDRELRSGNPQALDAFWTRLKDEGAPIIEPISGDNGHSLVTFVWQNSKKAREAAVSGPGMPGFLDANMLQRLDGTDLWYRTYSRGNDFRSTYLLALNPPPISLPIDSEEKRKQVGAYFANRDLFLQDPLNRNAILTGAIRDPARPGDPPRQFFRSIIELSQAPPQLFLGRRPGIPHGWVYTHRFPSAILGNERRIDVYTPPGYAESEADYGLLIAFDGPQYLMLMQVNNILDNLLADGRVPPLVAVVLDNPDQATQSRELACHEPLSEALATEILPWLHEKYRVTSDPARVVVAGVSLGGLAASFVALRHPELYGNVISQSGSYWWGPGVDFERPASAWHADWQWLIREYASTLALAIRFYIDTGLFETDIQDPSRPEESDQLLTSRRMRDVLAAKGYEVHYSEYNGGHEWVCWRGSVSDALIALLGS